MDLSRPSFRAQAAEEPDPPNTLLESRKSSPAPTPLPRSSSSSSSRIVQRVLAFRSKPTELGGKFSSFNYHGKLGLDTLFTPSDPLVEYVFIHGLGGGSTRTWCLKDDPSYFWPKEWLPRHPAFRNVRIHSFGYDSDWKAKGQSAVTAYDFGQALLLALRDLDCFSANPIVLVTHSMGGIVAKEAYIMARQDPSCHELASRIVAMVFLATPHRGSDYATFLNNLLRISTIHGARSYISDLERVSASLVKANDAFRHYCDSLIVYSFFETRELSIAPTASALIVPKDSAVMGLPGERVSLMYADHRSICKFASPEDPGYITLTEAFNTINKEACKRRKSGLPFSKRSIFHTTGLRFVAEIAFLTVSATNSDRVWGQLRQIEAYLSMPEVPEDDLKNLDEICIAGSCDWFTDRTVFQTWLSTAPSSGPKLYWVYAKPATGKSVLASHVIKVTDDLKTNCSYYFFRHGDKVRSTLSGCLLSLAYQMAVLNVHVRNKLLRLIDRGVRFERENAKNIWRKILEPVLVNNGILQPQYWILDALDECSNIMLFFSILTKLEAQTPVKILVTSRRLENIAAGFAQLEANNPSLAPLLCTEIHMQDTQESVLQYLKSNQHKLHAGTEQQRAALITKIIDKAQGCFLWVRLVLDELSTVWTMTQIERVLHDVPQEMDQLYSRAAETLMARPAHSVDIAKTILRWTICAIRPLTIGELQSALQLDIGTAIQDPEDAIPSLCCQLAHVDKNGRVLIVHLTARTFLQNRGLESPLTFCPIPSHLRVLEVCLQLLVSDETKPPKGRRRNEKAAEKQTSKQQSALLNYAVFHFAEHMRRTTSNNTAVNPLLHVFLEKNAFTWIEFLAKHDSLHILARTADIIKSYYQRQSKYFPPLEKQIQLANDWTIDFHRLVAKFGTILVRRPSAIYSLIPPFCPSSSAIATVFGNPARRIEVVGMENMGWDDHLSCIDSGGPQCYAVAFGEGYFAVGFGRLVVLNNATTCQKWKELDHGDVVRSLGFDFTGSWLVSGGRRSLKVWELEESEAPRFAFSVSHDILTFSLRHETGDLIAALKNNTTVRWSLQSGFVTADSPWGSAFADEGQFRRPPILAAFSQDQSILAIAYRGRPIQLWDLEDEYLLGLVGRENQDLATLPLGTNTSPSSLVFHPEESVLLLAAAYEDGDLCLYNYDELKLIKMVEANAQILACSPDGALLATGNASGMFQLLDFETLQLLFRVNAVDYGIRDMSFSSDSSRLIDARGTQCNVWEPALSLGRPRGDDASSNWLPPEPRIVGLRDGEVKFTAIALEESSDWFFIGKSDGSVWLYRTSDGKPQRLLYRHGYQISVTRMVWGDKANILVTSDSSTCLRVYSIARDENNGFLNPIERMDVRGNVRDRVPISQLLLNKANDLLLVSTTESDAVWDLDGYVRVTSSRCGPRSSFSWANNPLDETERILVGTDGVEVWDWKSCHLKTSRDRLRWTSHILQLPQSRCVKSVSEAPNNRIIVEYSEHSSGGSTIAVYLLDARDFTTQQEEVMPSAAFSSVTQDLIHYIGICDSKAFFLDKRLGICSVEFLEGRRQGFRHVNHCFLPNDWVNRRGSLKIRVSQKGDILFMRIEDVAVVKNIVWFEDERVEVLEE